MKSIAYLGLLAGTTTIFHVNGSIAKEFDSKREIIFWSSEQLQSGNLLNTIKDPEDFVSLPKILPPKNFGSAIILSDADSVNISLINSPNIKSAVFQYQEQNYNLRKAYSAYYPSLTLYNSSYNWSESYETFQYGKPFKLQTATSPLTGLPYIEKIPASEINDDNISYSNTNSYNVGLELSYNLLDPKRDLDIAEEMEMKNYYYNMITEELKNEYQTVSNNLLEVKINDRYVSLYTKAADYAKSAYDKILESYLGGFSTKIDVNNYLAQYLVYKAQKATFSGKREEAVSSLLQSMGWPQNVEIILEDPLLISEKWPISKNKSLELAQAHSEKVKNLAIQSQKSYIKSQNALYGYIPVIKLSLVGTANQSDGEVILGWPYSSGEYATSASLSVGMTWSIFDGFLSINESRSFKKAGQSYNQQKENEIFTIGSKVASYIASQKAELIAYKLNHEAFLARKSLTELTSQGYMSGYNTVFDLIKAQQDAVESEESAINNAQTINQSDIKLQQLTGVVSCNSNQAISYCGILDALAPKSFQQLQDSN
jgi:outer membrane protein TolC